MFGEDAVEGLAEIGVGVLCAPQHLPNPIVQLRSDSTALLGDSFFLVARCVERWAVVDDRSVVADGEVVRTGQALSFVDAVLDPGDRIPDGTRCAPQSGDFGCPLFEPVAEVVALGGRGLGCWTCPAVRLANAL